MAKYSKEERLEIGKKIYEKELNVTKAAVMYDISLYTARDYMRMYKASLEVSPVKREEAAALSSEAIEAMSREELIRELKQALGMIG